MKREKLLKRQGGERVLGSSSLNGDLVTACVRLSMSPVKRQRDHLGGGMQFLPAGAEHDHGCHHDHNSKTRECVTKTLKILENDWLPLPYDDDNDDDDDCRSYTTVGTGMPSLASINPGSVTEASCSVHSSCGFSRFSSMTSYSSYGNNTGGDAEDCSSVTSRSISIVSEEPALRQRMRVLLLEDINEDGRAETLDCLEPVLPSSRDSSHHERTRWGSPPCDTEITVCRPREHYEGSTFSHHSSMTSRNGSSLKGRHDHGLASRNADEAPPLPPPVNRILSIDQSPMVPPRRQCASEVYVRPSPPPVDVDRRKSWDQIPYKPQRKNSGSRCTA